MSKQELQELFDALYTCYSNFMNKRGKARAVPAWMFRARLAMWKEW